MTAAALQALKGLPYDPSTHFISWSDMNVITGYYDEPYYPESYGLVHVTPSYENAETYAHFNAQGGEYEFPTSRAVIYEVEPADDMEPDEYDDGSYTSPTGFRVKNISWIDDKNVPVIERKNK
jgi:hypothetical protein